MADSLVIGEAIELVNDVVSVNPLCAGAIFRLQPGYDLGVPVPVTSIVGSLLLDGSRPSGARADNRTITLPIEIQAPDFQTLTGAREVLLREVDQQTWTLRWTRDTAGPQAGNTVSLPLLFDCFRAKPTVVHWGGIDQRNQFPIGQVDLTFDALPYARSDVPLIVDFPQALAGRNAPPPPVSIDTFASVSGTQWAASLQSPVSFGQSAFWDPGLSPGNSPSGSGLAATYSKSGLALDLAQGWTAVSQNTGTVSQVTITQAQAAFISVGDQFQLAGNALSANDSGFESGGAGGWFAYTNAAAPVNSTAQAHSGTHSLAMSSSAAGDMIVADSAGACLPGDNIYAAIWFRGAASARVCSAGAAFYDANNNFILQVFTGILGSTVTDSAASWVAGPATCQVSAPAGAASYQVLARVAATAGAAEVHYIDDIVTAGRASALLQTQIFTVTAMSPPSAGYVNVFFSPNAAGAPVLGNIAIQAGPPDLTGITFWAGFGSDSFYEQWARLGGRVQFAVTLTDVYASTLSFSRTAKCTGSNQTGAPRWHKIRFPVPYRPGFDYHNVAGYSVTVTNRGTGDLRYTQLYLSDLRAVPPPTAVVAPQRGAVYELAGLPGSARAPFSLQLQQTGTVNQAQFFTRPGTYYWTAPAGVTSVAVVAVGAGGGAPIVSLGNQGAGGGGAGGSAVNGAVLVTPGVRYKIVVGTGGGGGPYAFYPAGYSRDGSLSSFTGDAVTVTANGGHGSTSGTGAAGGAAGTGGFAGAAGGTGVASSTGGGGGGGSPGGSAAGGNTGANASGSTGGAGGAAVTPGGPGGRGGTFGHGNGLTPAGSGGGAGGSPANAGGYFYPGANGLVSLNYTIPKPFQSLVVHRPPPAAPESLSPVQPVSVGDPSDGTVVYTLQSIASAQNAQFGGTYTIAVVASSWASPASARTITVTVTQWEQQGGASYVATVSQAVTPNSLPALSGTPAGHGPVVQLGELTLPVQDMPQDNTDSYFTVAITSGQVTDSFSDILFLDTQGSTVIVESPTSYANMYLDEPAAEKDYGLILGSVLDRGDAVSILDRAFPSGPPLSVPAEGNPYLLVYCAEGSPQVQLRYFARWWLDRYQ